jgi:hypothetical protein
MDELVFGMDKYCALVFIHSAEPPTHATVRNIKLSNNMGIPAIALLTANSKSYPYLEAMEVLQLLVQFPQFWCHGTQEDIRKLPKIGGIGTRGEWGYQASPSWNSVRKFRMSLRHAYIKYGRAISRISRLRQKRPAIALR